MSGSATKRPQQPKKIAVGRIDRERVQRMSEREIMRSSPPELANLPADFWHQARLVAPVIKQAISLRLDPDGVAWFRSQGPRYQSRMNAVLRAYVAQMQTTRGRKRTGQRTVADGQPCVHRLYTYRRSGRR